MPDHTYEKQDLIQRFDNILGKKLENIDNKGIFDHVQDFKLQKGVAGTIIEQCVLGYPPDSKQEADLIVIDGAERTKTELKTTGMVIDEDHFVATMSITAVFYLLGRSFNGVAGSDFSLVLSHVANISKKILSKKNMVVRHFAL